jgi:D-arabinose 1-dehydrogenase-like Zn-dependent alcohol dehydrogenase
VLACREGGHIAVIGVLAGYKGEISTPLIMGKQLRIGGVIVGTRADQQEMILGIDVSGIGPMLDRQWRPRAAAFRYQESGAHVGKIGLAF